MSKISDLTNKRILISRTDSIGDVVLTLPLCVWLKKQHPSCTIIFLGNRYTKPVLACLPEIDEIVAWSELEDMPISSRVEFFRALKIDICIHIFPNKEIASIARKAKIPVRIGTSHRSFHLLTCTIRPNFSRKNSNLHESQLNFELLKPLGLKEIPTLEEIQILTTSFQKSYENLPEFINVCLQSSTKKIILHPKSQGSAVEWPIEKYVLLANACLAAGYTVIFTGTDQEGAQFRGHLPSHPNCIDTTGKLTLAQLIYLISQVDTLVACSTGPLHLAGILGKNAIGLFSPKRPIHPGRWKPLGLKTSILVNDENCFACGKRKACNCIEQISEERVLDIIKA
jgi:ADP-heptose:LPS heptosyltransferase